MLSRVNPHALPTLRAPAHPAFPNLPRAAVKAAHTVALPVLTRPVSVHVIHQFTRTESPSLTQTLPSLTQPHPPYHRTLVLFPALNLNTPCSNTSTPSLSPHACPLPVFKATTPFSNASTPSLSPHAFSLPVSDSNTPSLTHAVGSITGCRMIAERLIRTLNLHSNLIRIFHSSPDPFCLPYQAARGPRSASRGACGAVCSSPLRYSCRRPLRVGVGHVVRSPAAVPE